MKRLVYIVSIVLSLGGIAQAGVYKWVDENGQAQFGDKPVASQNTQRVKIHQSPEIDAATQEKIDRLNFSGSDEEFAAKKESEKRTAEYKEFCDKTQAHLSQLEAGGRLYEMGDNGERHYLSDEDRQQKISLARQDLKRHCQ